MFSRFNIHNQDVGISTDGRYIGPYWDEHLHVTTRRLQRRKGKKDYARTPRAPAKGYALCTPSSLSRHYGFLDYLPELPVHFDVACSFGGYLNHI